MIQADSFNVLPSKPKRPPAANGTCLLTYEDRAMRGGPRANAGKLPFDVS